MALADRIRIDRVPAPPLVLIGIVSVQVGAAIAKQLFTLVPPTTLVWLRLITSATILLVVFRPRVRGRRRRDWLIALMFGICLFTMNWAIYASFAHMPLGMAVTLEFLGPLTISIIGSRRAIDVAWAVLAAVGVALLGFSRDGLTVAGVLFALLSGLAWAGYILCSAQTGRRWPGLSGLVIASWVGAIVLAPPAIIRGGGALLDPIVLACGVGVGLLSSVVPYSLELVALRRMPPRVFGILMSCEPAAAALAAMIILREFLSVQQWLAVACVVAASVGASLSARRARRRPVEPAP